MRESFRDFVFFIICFDLETMSNCNSGIVCKTFLDNC